MSFIERITSIQNRIPEPLSVLETEEATKNALIMPFIAALGYDVFNPLEVVPEFTADVGTKRGEKVDYAIKRENEVIMLIEAKKATASLAQEHASQLYRYFSVTHARIGVLTNGLVYRFYSDLEETNKMDDRPFLELDLRDPKEDLIRQLAKMTKDGFDLEDMLSSAADLKYIRAIRLALERQFEEPDFDFVKLFFAKVNPNGRFTQSSQEQFRGLVKQTLLQVVKDRVAERLRTALATEGGGDSATEASDVEESEVAGDEASEKPGIETTEDELEGYRIVKAIVCAVLPGERVAYRDAKSYFSVLADDNNRRLICRLHLNGKKKYLGLVTDAKDEQKVELQTLEDIYRYSDQLRRTAERFAEGGTKTSPSHDEGAEPSSP